MKKIVIILFPMLILLLVVSDLHAQTIKFQLSDGTYKEYQLSDIDNLTFNDVSTLSVVNIFRKNINITRLYTAFIRDISFCAVNTDTAKLITNTLDMYTTDTIPVRDIDSIVVIENENSNYNYHSCEIAILNFSYTCKEHWNMWGADYNIDSLWADTVSNINCSIRDRKFIGSEFAIKDCIEDTPIFNTNMTRLCFDSSQYLMDYKAYLVVFFNKEKNVIDSLLFSTHMHKREPLGGDLSQNYGYTVQDMDLTLNNITYQIVNDTLLIAEVNMSNLENIKNFYYAFKQEEAVNQPDLQYYYLKSEDLLSYFATKPNSTKIRIVLRK